MGLSALSLPAQGIILSQGEGCRKGEKLSGTSTWVIQGENLIRCLLLGEICGGEMKAAHQPQRFCKEGVPLVHGRKSLHHSHGVCLGKRKQRRSLPGPLTPTLRLERTGCKVHPKTHALMGTERFLKRKHGGSMPVNHHRHRQKKGRKKAASVTSRLTETVIKE